MSNPAVKTIGVSPKVGYPALALVGLGVVLCVLDQLGVIDVDDELWIALLGASGITGGIGFAAPPSLQRNKPKLPVSASASSTLPDPPR